MNPIFLSHRGESDDAPENTMQAYQLAMDRESDGIELDIHLSADGRVVCVHDADLKRVAGVPAVIAENPSIFIPFLQAKLLSRAITLGLQCGLGQNRFAPVSTRAAPQ